MTVSWSPVSELLASTRPGDHPVARAVDAVVGWRDFSERARGLAATLGDRPERRWILCCQDSMEFAVGFLALLHAGKRVIMPPNAQPGSLADLSADADALLTDGDAELPGAPRLLTRPAGCGISARIPHMDRTAERIDLCTSGTTGRRKVVSKSVAQLEAELSTLEQLWGARLAGAEIISTISHQHIYGLLFRVLWPLCAGRCFWRTTFLYPEEMAPCMIAAPRAALISSPACLQRMPELVELASLRGHVAAIFSSGGPLSADAARRLFAALGEAPVEVLGSTETGGVAWRAQERAGDDAWTPLPGVEVDLDPGESRLAVRSPHLGSVGTPRFVMGDCARWVDGGRFVLVGRADRIVKIEEKRVSLEELERRLAQHDFVAEAAVIPVETRTRKVLGAAVVLSPAGREFLERNGRRPLSTHLGDHLLQHVERVALPRKWRFVDQLPRDPQGKRAHAALAALFAPAFDPAVTAAVILSAETEGARARIAARIPENLYYFNGHFPGAPVVPGVVQIHWVMRWAREYLRVPDGLRRMEAVKFHHLLLPGDEFHAALDWNPVTSTLSYAIERGAHKIASGRLHLAPAGA